MGTFNVSNAPLAVNFVYFSKLTDNPNYSLTTTSLKAAIPILEALDPALTSQLNTLLPYVTTNLGTIFQNLWTSIQAAQEASAKAVFIQQAASAGQSVTNVGVSLPNSGALTAATTNAVPASPSNPGHPGNLTFFYALPGCATSFDTGSLTAEWTVTFDAEIAISATVPILPFNIVSTTNIALSNANLDAENFVADAENLVSEWLNVVTFGLVPSAAGTVDGAVDAVNQSTNIAGIGTLLGTLNAAGPKLVSYGFSRCAFTIPDQSTLTLTITHPVDAAPALENPNDPAANHVLFNRPLLSVNDTQVQPGKSIEAVGEYFPVETADRLSVEWPDTSSGLPTGAQIQYEIVGTNTASAIAVSGPVDDRYAYTATGLAANTDYQFKARCGDALTWSAWTKNWFKLKTAATKHVQLFLQSAASSSAPSVVVGGADLAVASAHWSASALIPANTADGTYNLTAELSGVAIASTQIVVAHTLKAILQIIDPSTNQVIASPLILGGQDFTVRGENFPGAAVAVTIDGGPLMPAAAAGGAFIKRLTAPGDLDTIGPVTVTATSGGVSASVSFSLLGQPK